MCGVRISLTNWNLQSIGLIFAKKNSARYIKLFFCFLFLFIINFFFTINYYCCKKKPHNYFQGKALDFGTLLYVSITALL